MGSHHSHDHSSHDPSGHHHSHHAKDVNKNILACCAVITGIFMTVEVIGGLISGSLALLADAGHMLTDFAALVLAWFGFVIAKRPASADYTFGYDRFLVLFAFINGLSLFVLSIWICIEAYGRMESPSEVLAGPMLIIASVGLLVNGLVFWLLTRGDTKNLNMRGAILHVLGDLLGSVAAILAALIIMFTGWFPIDPLLSVLVALLILRSAYYLIKDSGRILVQGAPQGMQGDAIKADLLEHVPELMSIDHMHLWALTEERPIASMEVEIRQGAHSNVVKATLRQRLKDKFHLSHVTIDIINEGIAVRYRQLDDGPISK